ncbi:hypothetical protein LJC15_00995 [Desulfovibrio sp. OttesenSCG-928-G11]|nr:hypothetical protein [Desulfovibrio sp. OttesenSCG-928-G11]
MNRRTVAAYQRPRVLARAFDLRVPALMLATGSCLILFSLILRALP